MPKLWDKLAKKLQAKGMDKNKSYAIATSALQKSGYMKKGTRELTKKGRNKKA